jgi:hypothetical protein
VSWSAAGVPGVPACSGVFAILNAFIPGVCRSLVHDSLRVQRAAELATYRQQLSNQQDELREALFGEGWREEAAAKLGDDVESTFDSEEDYQAYVDCNDS